MPTSDEPVVNEREAASAARLKAEHAPIVRDWFLGDPVMTAVLNASSVTIPEAERFVIRALSEAKGKISGTVLTSRAEHIIHEETAHSSVHDAYNRYLSHLGMPVEKYERMAASSSRFFERHCSLLSRLALCAAIEHFTACMSKQILETGTFETDGIDARMDRVWTWHAIEELDHRSDAFDIYRALGGGYFKRTLYCLAATLVFLRIHTACMFALLSAEKKLFSFSAWRAGWPFLFGKRGVYGNFVRDWFRYFAPGFHPNHVPIEQRFKKQLGHYHIEEELAGYFPQ